MLRSWRYAHVHIEKFLINVLKIYVYVPTYMQFVGVGNERVPRSVCR